VVLEVWNTGTLELPAAVARLWGIRGTRCLPETLHVHLLCLEDGMNISTVVRISKQPHDGTTRVSNLLTA
jgi:hypothetical protein